MSRSVTDAPAAAISRVTCDPRSRCAAPSRGAANRREFACGERVFALRAVKNDGVYPHKDIGEVLVREGDAGVIRERWSFLGEIYYTVEFVAAAVVVIMRGREMVSAVGKDNGGVAVTTRAPWSHSS
jgi:nitrogen fixation protein NifZ